MGDTILCPACHHPDHDPGGCPECPRCELHTDEALAFVLRHEPELLDGWAAFERALPAGWSFWQMTEYAPEAGMPRRVVARVRLADVIDRHGMVPEVSVSGSTPDDALRTIHGALLSSQSSGR